ncbi:NAD-dependent epimerase/dehydratase family protein [Pseudolabrys sp.]|uniref:NAD-dependent epimerase/dehydratase family protein n=1 Tax=Pseudolabrys sp. TaxID=1960880 RepID=UPI003D0D3982
MKIAVTGATGFLGQHVTRRLNERGAEVVCVGRHESRWNGVGRFVPIPLSESGLNIFEKIGQPDAVLHLAWEGLPNYESLHHFETELSRQFAFLSALVRAGLRHLTVAGTCFEYGMQNGALSENMSTAPSNPYGHAKDALRMQLQFLQLEVPFELNWLRLFYVWGEGQRPTALYPRLRGAVERGDKSFKMSRGEQLRDFLPIGRVVEALANAVENGRNMGVVNICSGQPVSIRALVESWLAINGWIIELELGAHAYAAWEPVAFWGNPAKMRQFSL